jgi:hypothetical protein
LLGEAKLNAKDIRRVLNETAGRPEPELPTKFRGREVVRAVFVPETLRTTQANGVHAVSLRHLMGRGRIP